MISKTLEEKRDNVQKMIMEGLRPEVAITALYELQKDSVELNFDVKSGELKTIKVKSYGMTIEDAVDAVLAGLKRAREGSQ